MHDHAFHFKQFTIHHDKCAMKVGTDGVLLGAWTTIQSETKILDIGTGTGLIALMLAQKSSALIDAIEIDRDSFEEAAKNIAASPWHTRIKIYHTSLQDFEKTAANKYDLIVSNPPFFSDAYKAPDEARNIARHTNESLSFDHLLNGVTSFLKSEGRFCAIFPCKEGTDFIELAKSNNLFVQKLTRVKTKIEKQEKRLLIEFGFKEIIPAINDMVIQEEDLSFTREYIELTKEYYLGLKNP